VDTEGPLNFLSPSVEIAGCASLTSVHRLEVVNRTACYIADNLGQPINLEDMSRAAGMSKFHLHRVFQENVGTTLARYLGGVRLKAALDLLSAGETRSMSVLDVALHVGFEDASAFSRSFKRRYGLTPSSLRRGHRPREFPLLHTSASNAALDRGVTVVSLPKFWVYGYEVGGQKHKSFIKEAPDGFKLTWDTIRRHGVEGIRGELGLPTYSWVRRDEAWRLLCGFRSGVRLDFGSVTERAMDAGKWLRARHTGPYTTRWQTWQRLQLQQLRLGRPEDGREPFEEELSAEPNRLGRPCCEIYFPC
jgi:AraC-like DNA-binding protein